MNTPIIQTTELEKLLLARAKEGRFFTIHYAGLKIKAAKPTSTNPEALYVKDNEDYLGKVFRGKWLAARDKHLTAAQFGDLRHVLDNPLAALQQHGHKTGICGICGRTLRAKESIAQGIGPICAEKLGLLPQTAMSLETEQAGE